MVQAAVYSVTCSNNAPDTTMHVETSVNKVSPLIPTLATSILELVRRDSMIDRKPGRGWIFRPLLSNAESHRESYRFRMIIEPAALLEPGYQVDLIELEKCRKEQIDLLVKGERMEASQFLRQHLNTARITKIGDTT